MAPPSLQESGSQLHLPENAVILPFTVHALLNARIKTEEDGVQSTISRNGTGFNIRTWPLTLKKLSHVNTICMNVWFTLLWRRNVMCERAFQWKHGQQKEGLGLNIRQPQDQQLIQKSAFFNIWFLSSVDKLLQQSINDCTLQNWTYVSSSLSTEIWVVFPYTSCTTWYIRNPIESWINHDQDQRNRRVKKQTNKKITEYSIVKV